MKRCRCATCPHGDEPQPAWNFYRCSRAPDGLQWWCKTCMKAARQQSRRDHPEREREYWRTSYQRIKADPERNAVRLEGSRTRKRKQLGITPDRYRAGKHQDEPLIDSAPVVAAVDASGLLVAELEQRAGAGDGTIRKARERATMRTSTAVAILAALGLDPVEVGI